MFFGGYASRADIPDATRRSLVDFVRTNWPLAAQMIAGLKLPHGGGDEIAALSRYLRHSAEAEVAAAFLELDLTADARAFLGTAPVTKASGSSRSVRFRRGCWKFARRTLQLFADGSRRQCVWAQTYYEQHRARGHGHHAALRALAHKWLKVILAMKRQPGPDQLDGAVPDGEVQRQEEAAARGHPAH